MGSTTVGLEVTQGEKDGQDGVWVGVKVETNSWFASPGRGVIACVRGRHGSFRRFTGRHTLNFELSRKWEMQSGKACSEGILHF